MQTIRQQLSKFKPRILDEVLINKSFLNEKEEPIALPIPDGAEQLKGYCTTSNNEGYVRQKPATLLIIRNGREFRVLGELISEGTRKQRIADCRGRSTKAILYHFTNDKKDNGINENLIATRQELLSLFVSPDIAPRKPSRKPPRKPPRIVTPPPLTQPTPLNPQLNLKQCKLTSYRDLTIAQVEQELLNLEPLFTRCSDILSNCIAKLELAHSLDKKPTDDYRSSSSLIINHLNSNPTTEPQSKKRRRVDDAVSPRVLSPLMPEQTIEEFSQMLSNDNIWEKNSFN